jgi:hypothetical protein
VDEPADTVRVTSRQTVVFRSLPLPEPQPRPCPLAKNFEQVCGVRGAWYLIVAFG